MSLVQYPNSHVMPRRISVVAGVLTAVFLALSLASGWAAVSALRQLSDPTYDTSGMAGVQLRLHYELLLAELVHIDHGHAESADTATLQYDIVYQRLQNLTSRPPYNDILTDNMKADIATLQRHVLGFAPKFDAAADGDISALQGVLAELQRLQDDVNLLAARVIQLTIEFRSARRNDITHTTLYLIASIAGLVLTGGLFAFLLLRSRRDLHAQNQELAGMTRQLMQANNAKSEFLALMSHELRTPLNAITGFSEMIARQAFGNIQDERYVEYARDIRLSGEHLLHLINDILDLAKIEAGEMELSPKRFSAEEAIRDAVRIIPLQDAAEGSRVDIKIPDDLGEMRADVRSFRQIMINLIANADKYTPSDGAITVSADRHKDGGVNIQVSDTGVGIPAEDVDRVLEPFGQSRRDSHLAHDGTGLGLALSRQLMILHGGQLRLESAEGIGTTVQLYFPA